MALGFGLGFGFQRGGTGDPLGTYALIDGSGNNTAAVPINRISSHSHEFSTTGADAITA